MALLKTSTTQALPSTTGVIADQAVEQAVWQEAVNEPVVFNQEIKAEAPVEQAVAVHTQTLPVAAVNPMVDLQDQGFEGLAIDFTSYKNISLKTSGTFQDADDVDYGKEFTCRLQGSKKRWVYRGAPVLDNRRDVLFTYDDIASQNGVLVADKIAEWTAQGKQIEKKLYLEALVEMIAPGTAYDGDFAILSVAPTSVGRFSGHVAKCAALGGGVPSNVVTRVVVGAKITGGVASWFPWNFEVVKN